MYFLSNINFFICGFKYLFYESQETNQWRMYGGSISLKLGQ